MLYQLVSGLNFSTQHNHPSQWVKIISVYQLKLDKLGRLSEKIIFPQIIYCLILFGNFSVYLNIAGVVRADDVDLRILLGQRLVHHVNNVVSVVYPESETTKYLRIMKSISEIIPSWGETFNYKLHDLSRLLSFLKLHSMSEGRFIQEKFTFKGRRFNFKKS